MSDNSETDIEYSEEENGRSFSDFEEEEYIYSSDEDPEQVQVMFVPAHEQEIEEPENLPQDYPNMTDPTTEEIEESENTQQNYMKFTNPTLKELCRIRGLKVSGNKAQLVERLEDYNRKEFNSSEFSQEWKPAECNPLQRSQRDFISAPGPKAAVIGLKSPLEIFQFMIQDETLEEISVETNKLVDFINFNCKFINYFG